ncbi:hypothetical protein [Methylobacterium sp. Leaf108]|uniref:hypothetical protein n=1 Tax=Methylobacterium sp. Leaf108 TaxID=1736256 RepID=UPI0012E7A062|nr:hypothetical protein [Methylobacterium sp. Leaf108]
MAYRELSLDQINSGKLFLLNLKSLGMNPEGMGWAWDKDAEAHTLLLFTSVFDRLGPHEIYDLLFLAYRKQLTTPDVPPTRIYVTSPKTTLYQCMAQLYNRITVFDHVVSETLDRGTLRGMDAVTFSADQTQNFQIFGGGIYLLEGAKPSKASISGQAKKFRENIIKRAA